jgi:hypothetical protein
LLNRFGCFRWFKLLNFRERRGHNESEGSSSAY